MKCRWICALLCLGLGMGTWGSASAQEMDAEMAAWIKAGTPGEHHKLLDYMVGEFTCTVKMWMPNAPEPMVSTGTSQAKWDLGDRYVFFQYKGDMMGMPFEGMGCAGYDNIKKRFFSMWLDSMSTGYMIEHGQYDAATKTFTYTGEFPTPQGSIMKSKSTIQVVSNDKHIMTMYHGESTDKLQKVMEATYERGGSIAAGMKVKAGCGVCTFKLAEVNSCCVAVEIDGKAYPVTGASVDAPKAGLCGKPQNAVCKGEVKGGKFVATSFELQKK